MGAMKLKPNAVADLPILTVRTMPFEVAASIEAESLTTRSGPLGGLQTQTSAGVEWGASGGNHE
jgi:hypothetical protein